MLARRLPSQISLVFVWRQQPVELADQLIVDQLVHKELMVGLHISCHISSTGASELVARSQNFHIYNLFLGLSGAELWTSVSGLSALSWPVATINNEVVGALSLLSHGGDPRHPGQQPGRTVKSATDSNIKINISINISIKDTFKKVYCLLISGEYLYRWEKEMTCHQKLRQLLKVVLDQHLFWLFRQ